MLAWSEGDTLTKTVSTYAGATNRRTGLPERMCSTDCLYLLLLLVAILLAYFFTLFPSHADRILNRTSRDSSLSASPRARQLHDALTAADMHSDFLMWNRGLLNRSSHGHVDLPRLIEGNVALQGFSVATKMPVLPRQTGTRNVGDVFTPLLIGQRWPHATWWSLKERALYQAHRLLSASESSNGKLTVIRSSNDLDHLLERRNRNETAVGAVLLMEGLHALEGDIGNVDVFFEAGFRVMAPTHFFDNEMGGSAHGVSGAGLTEFGERVIQRMEELGIVADLAHASPRMVDDVMDIAARPAVVSHTGVKGMCDNPRNIADYHVRRIAGRGGVVCIGFWKQAAGGIEPADVARSIRYVADLAGIDHAGLGSDFDGAVRTRIDAAGLAHITDALLASGFSDEAVGKVMGGNIIRLLRETLPAR